MDTTQKNGVSSERREHSAAAARFAIHQTATIQLHSTSSSCSLSVVLINSKKIKWRNPSTEVHNVSDESLKMQNPHTQKKVITKLSVFDTEDICSCQLSEVFPASRFTWCQNLLQSGVPAQTCSILQSDHNQSHKEAHHSTAFSKLWKIK